jgi:hypothetical protein
MDVVINPPQAAALARLYAQVAERVECVGDLHSDDA